MDPLVVTLIGIITIRCGDRPATLNAATDPCRQANRSIEMFIADGRTGSTVCKTTSEPITPHLAFVRIRGERARPTNWPGIECDDRELDENGKLTPCVLYPLRKDRLTITGLSSGPGVEKIDPIDDRIRWSFYDDLGDSSDNPLVLSSSPGDSVARMTIDAGKVTFEKVFHNSFATVITVANVPGDRTIEAINNVSGVRTLVVTTKAEIDIVNLPLSIALSDYDHPAAEHDDDCDHFFLHYQLANKQPTMNCKGPHEGVCQNVKSDDPHAGLTVSCSNSTYP